MAKMSGNIYYNFSKGGLTTKSWLTNEKGAALAFDGNHICEAYIIGLGVNDKGKLGTDYLGTIDDIDLNDYNNNADTYYGNYGKIIQKCKEQQPKAKFFLLTNPLWGDTDVWQNAIKEIANKIENCYLVDLTKYKSEYTDSNKIISISKRTGHYNAIAYEYMAEIISNEINNVMNNNLTEFLQIEFIGTDYEA